MSLHGADPGIEREMDVVVVGGGITGLAAAHRLLGNGPEGLRVVLVEADGAVGGKIRTRPFRGHPVDDGPDGILDNEVLRDLLGEVTAAPTMVPMARAQPGIWTKRGIRPLPGGLIGGVPVGPVAVMRSRLLSPLGLARAGLDLVLPPSPLVDDVSVADLVGRRLGHEVVERLVGPLVGAVYAGDVGSLSAEAVTPPLFAAARRHRSLILSLRRQARSGPASASGRGLVSFQDGLGSLVDALARSVGDIVRTNAPVTAISGEPGAWLVTTPHGRYRAAVIILVTPADVTARLLQPIQPAAAELAQVPYASVGVVTLAYGHDAVDGWPTSSGFLVPASSGRLVTACSWLSVKWPHTTDAGTLLLRCSVGRSDDERWLGLDDDRLVEAVRGELAELAGLRGAPLETRVRRWPRALPQYRVGHVASIARVRQALGPTVLLAGAAFGGIGVTTCIAQGRAAADAAIDQCAVGARHQKLGSG